MILYIITLYTNNLGITLTRYIQLSTKEPSYPALGEVTVFNCLMWFYPSQPFPGEDTPKCLRVLKGELQEILKGLYAG